MITCLSGAVDTANPAVLWSNALGRGTLVASTAAADGAAANALGPQTYDFWTPTAMPATLTATLPAAELVDCFAIAAHNLGTKAATVTLAYSVDLVAAYIDVATLTPTDDDAQMLVFPAVSARRLRLTVAGASIPSIGIASIGKRLVFPGGIQPGYVPFDRARRVQLLGGSTLGGHFLGNRVTRRGADMSVKFTVLPRTWADADLVPFNAHYDAGGAFFFAGSPSFLPQDCAYAWRSVDAGEMRPALQAGGKWVDVGMELAAYAA
ncbi:hypothetical protein HYN69_10560 [Gemmobacter aquarius]|uniref:F5/8 type C domain-containing protein n=2 Tax=Paragemmobacter aquarius TaxID=2169400 RepID=A0A2S0UM46_9RHOB|nr:hypothetical protein HYN69_10560 [Gemmobacter aquarius]